MQRRRTTLSTPSTFLPAKTASFVSQSASSARKDKSGHGRCSIAMLQRVCNSKLLRLVNAKHRPARYGAAQVIKDNRSNFNLISRPRCRVLWGKARRLVARPRRGHCSCCAFIGSSPTALTESIIVRLCSARSSLSLPTFKSPDVLVGNAGRRVDGGGSWFSERKTDICATQAKGRCSILLVLGETKVQRDEESWLKKDELPKRKGEYPGQQRRNREREI